MVRRRGASGRVVVDLGTFGAVGTDGQDDWHDDTVGAGPDPSAPASSDDEQDAERLRRVRARRTRGAVAAAVVAFLALSAWGAGSEVQARARTQRLMAAPGGVVSLADAPRVTWSAATESAGATAYLPGLVVVRRGAVLHGLDAGTGAERWQVPVTGDPQCQVYATWYGGSAVVDPLVCWGGPNAAPQVTVVHADGSWSTRALEAGVSWATGTADGGIATVRAVGAPPAAGQVTVSGADGGFTMNGTITQGQDVVVRLEDATTGAERWQRTLPFRPGDDGWSCGSVGVDRSGAQPAYTFTPRQPSVAAVGGVVQVDACGVHAALPLDGTGVIDAGGPGSTVEPYLDGGVLEVRTDRVGSTLHRPGGVVTFPARVLDPMATDGTPSDLVLAGSGGAALAAFGPDGTRRWRSSHSYQDLLVRADGIAVLSFLDGGAAGVDLRTGDQLWTRYDLVPTPVGAWTTPQRAFTDGHVAALLMVRYPSTVDENGGAVTLTAASADLVGLDLATGEVRWRTALPDGGPDLDAVAGHLVDTAQRESTVVGSDGAGGASVTHSPGTVSSLG
jgi:hypothetical protein